MAIDTTISFVTDINDLVGWGGLTSSDVTANSTLLETLVNQVASFMERYTSRKLKARDYDYSSDSDTTDSIGDGDGTTRFYTKQWPINSVTTLVIGDDTISAASDWDDDGYFIYPNEGCIYYEDGFDKYKQNIKLKYNAGYNADHSEYDLLKMITCALVGYIWENRDKLGFRQEFLGRYRYTKGSFKDVDSWVWETLDSFKRRGVA